MDAIVLGEIKRKEERKVNNSTKIEFEVCMWTPWCAPKFELEWGALF